MVGDHIHALLAGILSVLAKTNTFQKGCLRNIVINICILAQKFYHIISLLRNMGGLAKKWAGHISFLGY